MNSLSTDKGDETTQTLPPNPRNQLWTTLFEETLHIDKYVLSEYYRTGEIYDEDSSVRRGKQVSGRFKSSSLSSNPQTFCKRNIDWNRVFMMWSKLDEQEQTSIAETHDKDGFYPLHYIVLAGAPNDIVACFLKSSVSKSVLMAKCGWGMKATPLHLACFARCALPTLNRLLEAAPEAVYVRDAFGRFPLHLATLNRAEDLVEVLLLADAKKDTLAAKDAYGNTALQLAVGRSSKVVACLLKACQVCDASTENDFQIKEHFEQELPLHMAMRSDSPLRRFQAAGKVVHLLTSVHSNLLSATDHRGQTALHVAISEGNTSTEALRALLLLDVTNATLSTKDVLGMTPMDIFLEKICQQPESALPLVKALVRADDERCFWAAVDDQGESILDRYVRHLFTNSTHEDATTKSSAIEVLYNIILATPPGTGFYGISVTKSQAFLGQNRYEKFLGDPQWYRTMNLVMSKRIFTFYFMLVSEII